jgi:anti-sigma B factor antagonist
LLRKKSAGGKMTFSITELGERAVIVKLVGELDATTSEEVREALERVPVRGKVFEVDLSQLRMIDSVGIGLLVAFYKRAREQGGEVFLRDASGQPSALLRLVHLDRLMTLTHATGATVW